MRFSAVQVKPSAFLARKASEYLNSGAAAISRPIDAGEHRPDAVLRLRSRPCGRPCTWRTPSRRRPRRPGRRRARRRPDARSAARNGDLACIGSPPLCLLPFVAVVMPARRAAPGRKSASAPARSVAKTKVSAGTRSPIRSGGETAKAVESASASAAVGAMTLTARQCSGEAPVRGSKRWWPRRGSAARRARWWRRRTRRARARGRRRAAAGGAGRGRAGASRRCRCCGAAKPRRTRSAATRSAISPWAMPFRVSAVPGESSTRPGSIIDAGGAHPLERRRRATDGGGPERLHRRIERALGQRAPARRRGGGPRSGRGPGRRGRRRG